MHSCSSAAYIRKIKIQKTFRDFSLHSVNYTIYPGSIILFSDQKYMINEKRNAVSIQHESLPFFLRPLLVPSDKITCTETQEKLTRQ